MSRLEILSKELEYQEKVYQGKTQRYKELMIEYNLLKCFYLFVIDKKS